MAKFARVRKYTARYDEEKGEYITTPTGNEFLINLEKIMHIEAIGEGRYDILFDGDGYMNVFCKDLESLLDIPFLFPFDDRPCVNGFPEKKEYPNARIYAYIDGESLDFATDEEAYNYAESAWYKLRGEGNRTNSVSAFGKKGLLFMNGRNCQR